MSASSVIISLRHRHREALRAYAADRSMGDAEAAAQLLSAALEPYLQPSDNAQLQAEQALLAIATELAAAKAAKPEWDEHLTLAVFQQIEREHLDLYETAAGDSDRQALNRRLGRRIKEGAGASVKRKGGKPALKHAPAGSQSLIKIYSLLARSV